MDQPTSGRIVTTTDGSEAGTRGVVHAAQEAARRHLDLQILHVVPSYIPAGPIPIVPDSSFQDTAKEIVRHAAEAARAAASTVEVSTSILVGGRVSSIVREAEDAQLLVIGGRDATAAERVWTGTTVTGVAARSTCPVLVVPPGYTDAAVPSPRGRIVAGVKKPDDAGPVLRAAFAEAERTGSHVLVVHAWRLAPGYDDIVADRTDRQEWSERIGKELDEQLVPVRADFPQVESEVELVHGQAAHLLVGLSRESDRLVISRPARGGYLHHLGATARAVLREAACPVEVVPPRLVQPASTP